MMILKADTDKPHRCPECWRIPDAIYDDPRGVRYFQTYTCQNGHQFAMWRRFPTMEELGIGFLRPYRLRWKWQDLTWRFRP